MNVYRRRLQMVCWILILMGGIAPASFAQVEVSHKGDWFFIEPGTDVYIYGSLISTTGNTDPLSNLGGLYITDSVSCYGDNLIFGPTPDTISANIYLTGTDRQTFTGDKNMRFGNLYIQNTFDSLRLENNVEVYNFIEMDSGNIDLDLFTLDLLTTGRLVDENNDRRIYSGPYGNIHLNRPLISGQTYTDLMGTGFGLTIDGNLGTNVDVHRGNTQQPTVSNGSIDRYYYFNPQLNGAVSQPTSEYYEKELQGNDEENLQYYLSSSSGVTWQLAGGTIDTVANMASSDTNLAWVLTPSSMLTLAENECDTVPFLQFARDTISICGSGNTWLAPNGITGLTSIWSNGIQNQDSIQVSTAGTYVVTVTDLAGCPNTDSVVVAIAPVPVADFRFSPACVGDSSVFTNQSTLSSGTLSYAWDLNDVYTAAQDTSSLENPSIIYTNPGNYTTTLIATSAAGCSASQTKTAVVLAYPVPDFVVADLCADSVLSLANISTVTPTAGITYTWDFGNGDSAFVAQPQYDYATPGTQTIILEATSNGCAASISKTVEVHPNPVANFTYTDVCIGTLTPFNSTSTLTAGSLNPYWSFAAGNHSTLTNPTFGFGASGTHPVNLEITSNQGCVDDTTIDVVVNALPQPTFTVSPTCQGAVANFINGSSPSSSYLWNFNGEGTDTTFNPQFTFTSSGSKNIVLTETDTNGCVNTITQVMTSLPAPTADFSVTGNCEDASIAFLNNTSTPSGTLTYTWDFDNASTSTMVNPTTTYGTAGSYNVELIADNNGCLDTIVQAVNIDPLPVVNLGGAVTTCDTQYVFDALNAGSTYQWSNATTAQTLTAVYNGMYWVEVTNGFGCVSNDTVQLTLNTIVQPQLGPDATFCNSTTLSAGYPGSTYLWNTGATTQTISTTSSGLFWVEVTDQNNCVGRDSIQVTVVPATFPNLGPDLSLCDGVVETLDPVTTGAGYVWNTGATTATLDISQAGTYWVDLTSANGCVERDSIEVVYNANPIVDLGPDGIYCDSVAFDLSQPNTNFLWNTGATSATETFFTTGLFSVVLTDVTSGCQSSDSIQVTISGYPIVDLGADTILCSGANILLDAANPGFTYSWNVGGNGQTLSAASTGVYAVTVTSPDGCATTDSIDIAVSAPFDTDLGADFTLCQGQSVQVTSPVHGGTYEWSLDGSLLAETGQSLTVTAFGSYSLLVTDSLGCTAADTIVALETGSAMNAEFLVSTTDLYEGDTLQFVNLSHPGNYTSYWAFGDGAFSIAEDPQHVYFAAGNYTVTLEVTNGVCASTLSKNLNILSKVEELPPVIDSVLINNFARSVLYPNPNNGDFTIEVELLKEGELYLTCFDLAGHVLFTDQQVGKDFKLFYQGLNVAAGMYFVNLRVSERSKTIKFIKLQN